MSKRGWNGRLVAGGLALAAIGATCGGDGATFSSGLEKGAELGTLSPGDADKLCQALNNWMQNEFAGEIKELTCRGTGIAAGSFAGGGSAAQQQAACKAAYDQCLKQPSEAPKSSTCDKPSASCKATVGELESCINDMSPLLQQVISSFPTCDKLGTSGGTAPPTDLQPPASCKTLETKCPDMGLPSFPG